MTVIVLIMKVLYITKDDRVTHWAALSQIIYKRDEIACTNSVFAYKILKLVCSVSICSRMIQDKYSRWGEATLKLSSVFEKQFVLHIMKTIFVCKCQERCKASQSSQPGKSIKKTRTANDFLL